MRKERKGHEAKVPGSEMARERKGQGASWPGSESARVLLADSLRGANWPGSEKARYRAPAQETAKHRAKCGSPPLSDFSAATKPRREIR